MAMAETRTAGLDFSEVRFRSESIAAGVKLTLVTCAAGVGYTVATWDQPDRQLIISLFAIGAAIALAFVLIPHERVVRSRWREPFFFLWSVMNIGLAAAVAAADGGSDSALALLFFMPLIYAALSYPLFLVVAVGALDYIAYVFVGVAGSGPESSYVGFFAFCLACTAVLCAWHASNQERRRAELARVSRADPLTGCLNRRGFEERFEAELNEAARTGRPLGLIMLDLDHFKGINDSRGHAAGDELLRWSVDAMQRVVRPMDTLGRIGGDEFAVIVPGGGPLDSSKVARRIQKALSPRAPASAGLACFPTDGTDREELHRYADDQLYEGKHGRAGGKILSGKELSWATALAHAVDQRMAVQHKHSQKVAEYSCTMAKLLGWRPGDLELLQMAAILHDVGKVSVPDRILHKQDPPTSEEGIEIKKHPITGAEMVGRIEGLEPIVTWIRHSHEHFDGSGYPDGLKGEAIPLACRILHVADAFDAMTSNRTYRSAMSLEAAHDELRANSGSQFDPECVALFEEAFMIDGELRIEAGVHVDEQDVVEQLQRTAARS
jgi:diguanylate cyclase (GGDEF)-like protein/putative nucleotidyltransferase with HDIG domain